MSKISVTTIAGLTSGGDANKVKIESGDTLQVESNATVGGTLGVDGHGSIGNSTTIAGTRALTVVGATDGSGSEILNCYNSSLASKFSVRDDGIINAANLILAPTGIRVGGTAQGNTLDDYEEGSWTPVCGTPGVTGSYSVQLGRYIKVGNFCHVIFNLTINSAYTGSTSASFTIGGLPFATKAYDASLYAGGHIGYYFNVDHTNNNQTLVYQIPSGSSLTMELKGVGDAIGEQIVRPSMMGTNAVIRGSISYHTA